VAALLFPDDASTTTASRPLGAAVRDVASPEPEIPAIRIASWLAAAVQAAGATWVPPATGAPQCPQHGLDSAAAQVLPAVWRLLPIPVRRTCMRAEAHGDAMSPPSAAPPALAHARLARILAGLPRPDFRRFVARLQPLPDFMLYFEIRSGWTATLPPGSLPAPEFVPMGQPHAAPSGPATDDDISLGESSISSRSTYVSSRAHDARLRALPIATSDTGLVPAPSSIAAGTIHRWFRHDMLACLKALFVRYDSSPAFCIPELLRLPYGDELVNAVATCLLGRSRGTYAKYLVAVS